MEWVKVWVVVEEWAVAAAVAVEWAGVWAAADEAWGEERAPAEACKQAEAYPVAHRLRPILPVWEYFNKQARL